MSEKFQDDTSTLTQLGGASSVNYDSPSGDILETFPNRYPNRNYNIHLEFPEFTSVCPKTGQPDFATIIIDYIPDELCVETKSLKLYFFSFRNHGAFMESITNRILDDLVSACQPRFMRVSGSFNVRGGITLQVVAEHGEIKK